MMRGRGLNYFATGVRHNFTCYASIHNTYMHNEIVLVNFTLKNNNLTINNNNNNSSLIGSFIELLSQQTLLFSKIKFK